MSAQRIVGPDSVDRPGGGRDPLRLCVYATVALLGWVLGPLALLVFAGLGFAGYRRARRAGLTRSSCVLRDTRLVLAYLGLLVVAALVGIGWQLWSWR
jgi:hypothetical protein